MNQSSQDQEEHFKHYSSPGFSGSDILMYIYPTSEELSLAFTPNIAREVQDAFSSIYVDGAETYDSSETREKYKKHLVSSGKIDCSPLRTNEGTSVDLSSYFSEMASDSSSIVRNESPNTRSLGATPIASLASFSYSSFREKIAVRTIGRVFPKGYTRGPRTVAGTMVFNVLDKHELYSIFPGYVLLDQIPPFHIMLTFKNESGKLSSMFLFNVEMSTESQQMSVDDLIVRNSTNFYATDFLAMESVPLQKGEQVAGHLISGARSDTKKLLEKIDFLSRGFGETIDQRLAKTRRASFSPTKRSL